MSGSSIGYVACMARRLLPLLIGAILLLAPATAVAAVEHPRDFQAAEMVYGTEGWARTYSGLYWTVDGGAHWRKITPPIEHPARLGTVYFANPRRGWAISEEGREGANRDAFFATADGGVTWTRQRIVIDGLGTNVADASFAMAGHELVYALVREARNTAFSVGFLFRSRDGGTHWEQMTQRPPHAGQISFTDNRHGWLAGDGPSPAFYRTGDGGRHWTEVRLPRPPGLEEARADYLAPRFEPDGHGVLATTYVKRGGRAIAVLYTTADDGSHWEPATEFGAGIPGISLLAYRGGDAAVGYDHPGPGLTLLLAGAAPTHLAGTGLPTESYPSLSFSGAEDGFAYESDSECEILIHCTLVNQLYSTTDGGESWAPTTRP